MASRVAWDRRSRPRGLTSISSGARGWLSASTPMASGTGGLVPVPEWCVCEVWSESKAREAAASLAFDSDQTSQTHHSGTGTNPPVPEAIGVEALNQPLAPELIEVSPRGLDRRSHATREAIHLGQRLRDLGRAQRDARRFEDRRRLLSIPLVRHAAHVEEAARGRAFKNRARKWLEGMTGDNQVDVQLRHLL